MSDRRQVVVLEREKSDVLPIKAGVPQGFRLLFIIYINDIIVDIEIEMLIFADETSLFATGSDPAAKLSRDLVNNSKWSETWKVKFKAR